MIGGGGGDGGVGEGFFVLVGILFGGWGKMCYFRLVNLVTMSRFFFYQEQCKLPSFFSRQEVKRWLEAVAKAYGRWVGTITYVFCDDAYILEVNRKYLEHDYYTDVITFDYTEGEVLAGDVFVSLDTVASNAEEYGTTYEEELHRVVVHAVLHLIGFKDKTETDAAVMREQENRCLELLKSMRNG